MSQDPAFKLACGRLPDSGLRLCSQPQGSFEAGRMKLLLLVERLLPLLLQCRGQNGDEGQNR